VTAAPAFAAVGFIRGRQQQSLGVVQGRTRRAASGFGGRISCFVFLSHLGSIKVGSVIFFIFYVFYLLAWGRLSTDQRLVSSLLFPACKDATRSTELVATCPHPAPASLIDPRVNRQGFAIFMRPSRRRSITSFWGCWRQTFLRRGLGRHAKQNRRLVLCSMGDRRRGLGLLQ